MEELVAPIPLEESHKLALDGKHKNTAENVKRPAPKAGGCRIEGYVRVKKVNFLRNVYLYDSIGQSLLLSIALSCLQVLLYDGYEKLNDRELLKCAFEIHYCFDQEIIYSAV